MRRITKTLETKASETGQLGQLQAGATLQDRYLILGILGSGGMSSVYKGRDLHFPNVTKLVAVKEILGHRDIQTTLRYAHLSQDGGHEHSQGEQTQKGRQHNSLAVISESGPHSIQR